MDEEEYNAMLRQAIRDRILNEVKKPRDVERIVNNVYGGPLTSDKNQGLGGGVTGEMAPEDLDYLVDITREDLPELNPLTGKPKGWKKTVVRRTQPRGATPPASDPEKKK
jgi:hypothetical protein